MRRLGGMTPRVQLALTLLRVSVAGILAIHGMARVWLGIVDDFGIVLGQWGFPEALAIAWTITMVEIAGGVTLAAGYLIRVLPAWFAIQLAIGIYFIHARAGWFVVGAGRNGAEFSVLLIICFVVVMMTAPSGYVLGRSR